jgi:hypothetical protein
MSVSHDIKKSARTFAEYVYPALQPYIGADMLVTVEGVDSYVTRCLDTQTGTDHLIHAQGSLYALGSRVEYDAEHRNGFPYNNFTIREANTQGHDCEWQKVQRAIDQGGIFPRFWAHAYMARDGRTVLSAAFIQTEVLWRRAHELPADHANNPWDGNLFRRVRWSSFTRSEICVIGPLAPQSLRRDLPFIQEYLCP